MLRKMLEEVIMEREFLQVELETICSMFHTFCYSKYLAFAMAALVVLVALISTVPLGIEVRLGIE